MPKKASLRLEDIKYVTPVDGDWYVRIGYKDQNGKRRHKYKKVETVDEAVETIAQFKRELHERGPGAWDGERMEWEDLVAEYKKQDDGKTKPWYYPPLEYFNGRKIRSIGYGDCRRFRDYRDSTMNRQTGQPRTVATVNRELEVLRKVMMFGCQHGWMLRHPMKDGKSLIRLSEEEQRERIPTPDEEERLLAVCIPPRAHLRLLVIGTLDTGLRKSALQALKWKDVNWADRLLLVPRPKSRHKGRPKVIGLTARLYEELHAYHCAACPGPLEGIVSQVGDFGRSYETACRLAGIQGLRYNDLRHGYATSLMEAGVPDDLAMKAAGHKNREIHGIYTNIDARIARQVADKLDELHRQRVSASSDLVQ